MPLIPDHRIAFFRRHIIIIVLGFASGVPLSLTGQAIQAWLTSVNVDLTTIGFLTLVAIPYSLKFLWAPLMDRFEPRLFGRRRSWLIITQLGLALSIWQISTVDPITQITAFASLAIAISFLSASQDIVFDAWRTDNLPAEERGLGSSLMVASYRGAMVLSGGIAFIWAEQWQSWAKVYEVLSLFMLFFAFATFILVPTTKREFASAPQSNATKELLGFFATIVGVALGVGVVELAVFAAGIDVHENPWLRLCALLLKIAFALPLALWMSKRFQFTTLNTALSDYFQRDKAWAILLLIVLYKLGDAFAGSLTTPFLLKAMQFTQAEVGIVNKIMGIWASVLGALAGGFVMLRIGLWRALLIFGALQLLSNFGFLALAVTGRNALGGFSLPPFDIVIASLDHSAQIDTLLGIVIFFENFAGGLGTAAFLALLTTICYSRFSATQFALVSALSAIGRVYVGPLSGVLAPAIGWPLFFIFTATMALPGLILLWKMRHFIYSLDAR